MDLRKKSIIEKIHRLPGSPGVYQFLNLKNKIIYIGKAKNIKKRVKSYFQNIKNQSPKNIVMIKHIVDFEWILVRSEVEALITEANLIKKYRPKYNIDLRDDKSFPYIKITKEPFPQVLLIRKVIKDGSKYFGPFTDVKMLRNIMKALRKAFPIRSCTYYLDDQTIIDKKVSLCLDYHIKKCEGPCEGIVSQNHYMKMISCIEAFMKGNINHTLDYIHGMMRLASSQERYEDAIIYRDQLEAINTFREKQSLVANDLKERDVVVLANKKSFGVSVVIRIRNGRIFSREKIYLNNINSNINDVMKSILIRFYLNSESIPKEISLQVKPTDEKNIIRFLKLKKKTKVNFIYPKIGEKSKELRISYQNAKLLLGEWIIKKNKYNNFVPNTLSRLKEDLRLKNLPKIIEAFDISHLSGSDTVASMVCFIDSKPKKNKYRKYNIKSVSGIDDFLSIYEVVFRRYNRLKLNNEVMPDLILIDGGKGQLKYALKALKELSLDDIPVVGLAKRLEEIFIPGNSEPQTISKQSPGLILLRRIRDEAHRFAITFQRSKRFKTKNKSIYLQIKGFGEKRLKVLMENFEGYKVIADSTPEEIKTKTKIPLKLAEKVIEISRSLLKK